MNASEIFRSNKVRTAGALLVGAAFVNACSPAAEAKPDSEPYTPRPTSAPTIEVTPLPTSIVMASPTPSESPVIITLPSPTATEAWPPPSATPTETPATPTPEPPATSAPMVTEEQFLNDLKGNHPKTGYEKAAGVVSELYSAYPNTLPQFENYFGVDPQTELNRCKTGTDDGSQPKTLREKQLAISVRQLGCEETGFGLIYEYGMTHNPEFYNAYLDWNNYVFNENDFKKDVGPFKDDYISTSTEIFQSYVH